MKYFEAKITLLLKKDVSYKHIHDFLSTNLNKAFLLDENLKILHSENHFKPFCYDSLYPFEAKTKIYNKNNVYVFTIRSPHEDFINSLTKALKAHKALDFQVLAIEKSKKDTYIINSVITATPAIFTKTNEKTDKVYYWTKEDGSLEFVKKRITDNLHKKYKFFFDEDVKVPDDFIQLIQMQNIKPIVFDYKNTKLFTNRFKIVFNEDENSQKLANLAYTVGIGEKSGLGFGFLARTRLWFTIY